MRLTSPVDSALPLLVIALEEEAAYVKDDLPVLITGMGKINAAGSIASVLARGDKPSEVINIGTAGALKPGWSGTHEVSRVLQHDFDNDTLALLTGKVEAPPLSLSSGGPTLATGDSFISDTPTRTRLALVADLVDMEGYAIASVARRFGVPTRLVKHVSDEADDNAQTSWARSLDKCAQHIAAWVRHHLP